MEPSFCFQFENHNRPTRSKKFTPPPSSAETAGPRTTKRERQRGLLTLHFCLLHRPLLSKFFFVFFSFCVSFKFCALPAGRSMNVGLPLQTVNVGVPCLRFIIPKPCHVHSILAGNTHHCVQNTSWALTRNGAQSPMTSNLRPSTAVRWTKFQQRTAGTEDHVKRWKSSGKHGIVVCSK